MLNRRAVNRHLRCPLCRAVGLKSDISYVDVRAPEKEAALLKKEEEAKRIKVQGSLSTKVEGVVRLMLRIKQANQNAKVLIFSTWVDVLDVIGDAFAQNGITYRALYQHSKFQTNLSSFRRNAQISALLLPISSGANGLNLVEAEHVMLVEPILNPAAEMQVNYILE